MTEEEMQVIGNEIIAILIERLPPDASDDDIYYSAYSILLGCLCSITYPNLIDKQKSVDGFVDNCSGHMRKIFALYHAMDVRT